MRIANLFYHSGHTRWNMSSVAKVVFFFFSVRWWPQLSGCHQATFRGFHFLQFPCLCVACLMYEVRLHCMLCAYQMRLHCMLCAYQVRLHGMLCVYQVRLHGMLCAYQVRLHCVLCAYQVRLCCILCMKWDYIICYAMNQTDSFVLGCGEWRGGWGVRCLSDFC